MAEGISGGLEADHREIQCLPAYVPAAAIPDSGRAIVLDLGGSRVRTAELSLAAGALTIDKGPIDAEMPWRRKVAFDTGAYLDLQADLIARLDPESDLPLGYCFSYPTRSLSNRDAVLLKWTKDIAVPGIEGRAVGRMLVEHLRRRHPRLRCRRVTVVNDTVAGLFSGLAARPQADALVGLVVGTGTNMATFMDPESIGKLSGRSAGSGPLPVNLESGNFTPPHLTEWDRKVDERSDNPGRQRFEKAVSGAYLGHLFKAVCPNVDLDADAGARGLVDWIDAARESDGPRAALAAQIYARSARLTAAALAGLVKLLDDVRPRKSVRVVAEGALFYSSPGKGPRYADLARTTLETLMPDLGLANVAVDFAAVENANLRGTALAAMAGQIPGRGARR